MSTPRSIRWRASPPNLTSLAAMFRFPSCCVWLSGLALGGGGALDDAHDVGLLHDEEFLAIQFHLGARPLAEQDAIAGPYLKGDDLALIIARTWTGSDDLSLHRLFLGGVGDDDPAHSLRLGIEAADHHPIMQRTKFHEIMTNLVPAVEGWSTCPIPLPAHFSAGIWRSGPGSAKHLGRWVIVF